MSDLGIPNLASPDASPHFHASLLKPDFERRGYLIVDPSGWHEAFDAWLAAQVKSRPMSAQDPFRVWQHSAVYEWNRCIEPLDFAHSLPCLFRSPVQTRELAASALWGLQQMFKQPVVAETIVSSPDPPLVTSLGRHRLIPNVFLGAHLRVAADAAAVKWPGYEAQAPFYLAEAKRLNLTKIYLATGSEPHRGLFRTDAAREGIEVITKEDLDAHSMAQLTWDQQALVDEDVLMYSSCFCGMVRSSFSWKLAMRRNMLPEAGTATLGAGGFGYRDGLSMIVGLHDNLAAEGMWS